LKYEKSGFLPVQRTENLPWQEYSVLPDVVLMGYDPNVTLIDLNLSTPVQVAQGGAMNDTSGTRRARLIFMQGTTAQMKLSGGSMQSLDKLHVRATEFTVGTNGPNAMPGDLPPNSAYTYALEYSVDEAVAAGATDVIFNQPVISYEENFLSFPTGTTVPTGYYDRASGRWVPSSSGRVVKILSISSGQANLDLDGSNMRRVTRLMPSSASRLPSGNSWPRSTRRGRASGGRRSLISRPGTRTGASGRRLMPRHLPVGGQEMLVRGLMALAAQADQ
jgi:hypothetical protein